MRQLRLTAPRDAREQLVRIIDGHDADEIGLVEVDARFTRPDIPGQTTLLAVVYVQPLDGQEPSDLEDRLGVELSTLVSDRRDVVALVTVTAIPTP